MFRNYYILFLVFFLFLLNCAIDKTPVFVNEIDPSFNNSSENPTAGIFWWRINGLRVPTTIDHYEINHGEWFIKRNALYQTNPISPPDHRAIYTYFVDDYFSLSTDLTVIDDDGRNYAIGLIFRAKDLSNYYYIYLGQGGEIATAKVINGKWHLIYSKHFEKLAIGQKTRVRIDISPGNLSVYRDGNLKYSIPLEIPEFSNGKVGFTCSWGASAKFENTEIQLF